MRGPGLTERDASRVASAASSTCAAGWPDVAACRAAPASASSATSTARSSASASRQPREKRGRQERPDDDASRRSSGVSTRSIRYGLTGCAPALRSAGRSCGWHREVTSRNFLREAMDIRLSEFLRAHREQILDFRQRDVRDLPKARPLERPFLRDHVPELLDRIARLCEERASGGVSDTATPRSTAQIRAFARLDQGFDLEEVALEYSLLRKRILQLLDEQPGRPAGGEVAFLNECRSRACARAG